MFKSSVRWFLGRAGYQLQLTTPPVHWVRQFPHTEARPHATYAPWLADQEFQRVFRLIEAQTLVDQYRCFELWSLSKQTEHLPGDIVEVGVYRGGTGTLLASRCQSHIYLCDTFQGIVKAGVIDSFHKDGDFGDTSTQAVTALLQQANVPPGRAVLLKGIFPDETALQFPSDIRIRLLHVDVDVYQSAQQVTEWAWSRMTRGGFVVFDDYGFDSCDGVTEFVNAFAAQQSCPLIHNLNGHAVLVKL